MLMHIVATSGRQYWRAGNIKKAETARISNSQMWSWKPYRNHRKVNQVSAAQLSSAGRLPCVSTVQSLQICASSHGHGAGFTFTQSVVFILFPVCSFFYYLKEEAGCHWLSSRAQTCCGHPVRPFTFFSVPKDSCRPSVCDTKNTPNYHHHQQQQEEEEEATNKPQSVWPFSADYYISCCSAGQTKRAGKCGRLFDFSKSSDTTESESPHVMCGFRKVSGEPASTHNCFIIPWTTLLLIISPSMCSFLYINNYPNSSIYSFNLLIIFHL